MRRKVWVGVRAKTSKVDYLVVGGCRCFHYGLGHGGMRISDMVRAGILLDAVAVAVITVLVSLWTMWAVPGA